MQQSAVGTWPTASRMQDLRLAHKLAESTANALWQPLGLMALHLVVSKALVNESFASQLL